MMESRYYSSITNYLKLTVKFWKLENIFEIEREF
jgi:hypothetical protein